MPPAWQRTYRTNVATNVLPGSAAETVIATLVVSDNGPDAAVELEGWVKLTTGASTTTLVPRIRRDSVSGALVGDQTAMVIIGAVGETHEYGIKVVDTPGEVASQTYVLTLVQTACTVAGTVRQVLLRAITP